MLEIVLYLLLISPIVYFVSKKRAMSFGWGLFFCVFYSIIPGLIIILNSGKKGVSEKYMNKGGVWYNIKTILCFLFGAFFILYGIINYGTLRFEMNRSSFFFSISLGIGLIGNGIYLLSDEDELFYITDEDEIKKAND
jgi:uncharacterized membrane protein HdeD (DUF308 family)